jgi:hypothetical protein
MGLDAHLYVVSNWEETSDEKWSKHVKNVIYWRNHWQLQLYFADIYTKRTGQPKETFSCYNLQLSKEDCEQCIETIKSFELPRYHKYYDIYLTEVEYQKLPDDRIEFYRQTEKNQYKEDIDALTRSIELINQGNCIFYRSWW